MGGREAGGRWTVTGEGERGAGPRTRSGTRLTQTAGSKTPPRRTPLADHQTPRKRTRRAASQHRGPSTRMEMRETTTHEQSWEQVKEDFRFESNPKEGSRLYRGEATTSPGRAGEGEGGGGARIERVDVLTSTRSRR